MSDREPRQRSSDAEAVQRMWRMAGLGGEFAGAVGGLSLIGYFIDRWANSSPLWLIVLASMGFVGGLWNLIRAARRDFHE